jgi:hypothetical protein
MAQAQKQTQRPTEQIRTDLNSGSYSHLIFLAKESKTYIGKKIVSSTNVAWKTGYLQVED